MKRRLRQLLQLFVAAAPPPTTIRHDSCAFTTILTTFTLVSGHSFTFHVPTANYPRNPPSHTHSFLLTPYPLVARYLGRKHVFYRPTSSLDEDDLALAQCSRLPFIIRAILAVS